jgi:hypothetical protein
MSDDNRWYESYPDFTQGETPEEQAERLAHTINFMADEALGERAVHLMVEINFGIKRVTGPYILENLDYQPPYFQVLRDPKTGNWCAELSHQGVSKVKQSLDEMILIRSLGWLEPNEDSPNWHREYPAETPIYQIAADGAEGFIKGFA